MGVIHGICGQHISYFMSRRYDSYMFTTACAMPPHSHSALHRCCSSELLFTTFEAFSDAAPPPPWPLRERRWTWSGAGGPPGSHRDTRSASDFLGRGRRRGPSRNRGQSHMRHGTWQVQVRSVERAWRRVSKGTTTNNKGPCSSISTSCEVSTSNRVCAVSIQLCQEV